MKGFIDGCFDGFHYGHVYALFQASKKCDYLVAATHLDDDIFKVKGKKTLYDYDTRISLLKECKFINKVLKHHVPYNTTLQLIRENGCDFYLHGDDGLDKSPLKELKKQDVLILYKRTNGISTTDLGNRLNDYHNDKKVCKNNDIVYLESLFYEINNGKECIKENIKEENIVLLNHHWEIFDESHISLIKEIRSRYPNYKLYIDLLSPSNYKVYNVHEIAIILSGIKCIDGVLLKYPKSFDCEKIVYINVHYHVKKLLCS
jgi:ethanolamine-phosphate cytidylyltransferase